MHTHLSRAHDNIVRRFDLNLRSHTVRSQGRLMGPHDMWHQADSMRPRHHAQTSVFNRGGRQPDPNCRHLRVLQLFGDTVLVPGHESRALSMLVE